MKRFVYIILMSFGLFTACEKSDLAGNEVPSAAVLSVDFDGSTDVNLENLKLAMVGDDDLTQDEVQGLLWMREEEKVAGNLYSFFYNQYNIRIFGNIARSESTHMAAVHFLLDAFQIEDPALEEVGKFTNADLQKVYEDLKQAGEVSLVEALKVGAYVEELDILDLEEQLDLVENADIRTVYENLLRGSSNHLRAFTRVLAQNNVTYEPTVLAVDYYQEIISGSMERGGAESCANGYGYANGNGRNYRGQYQSQQATCDSIPASSIGGKRYRYHGGN
ncbi:MAG TPA: DUF2202 domain-containing protein [Sunxiuqinia sp.]|nr:DUF2202 domain-containing protein [Sunxiuqinia sp.]